MPRFRVTFRKVVYGNTGQARTICQRTVEVDALDNDSAEAAAIDVFCDREHVTDWLSHADWMETARLDQALLQQSIGYDQERSAA